VVVIAGCMLGVMGWRAFRLALPSLALLLLMNPLPAFVYNNLSAKLQLISSQLGVAVIRLFGISVFLEGNVIDLGNYQLQVVEACSGLRYLFPLFTLGVMVAALFKGRAWMRVVIVLSTVPITILMNSFRIGVIGVLVDRFGSAQAEGFLHDFEGWVIFMACTALLVAETWLLVRLAGDRRPLRDIIGFDWPAPRPIQARLLPRAVSRPAVAVLVVLLLAVIPARLIPQRADQPPARADFSEFPQQLGEWQGRRDRLDAPTLAVLQLDDYLLSDYGNAAGASVNFYVAYYASQRGEKAAHSPASCLPGNGWRMLSMADYEVPALRTGTEPLRVNRVVIEKGTDRQLVYYWFRQRGRSLTDEYSVKGYLLRDSLLRNRTDGALVRLVTPLRAGERDGAADARLAQFAQRAVPLLARHVPD
jgi:exosortase D (VPLPA-CTERM-specific)